MKTITFDEKEYVQICYNDEILQTKDAESLDYISKTLYGHIIIRIKTVSRKEEDDFTQVIRYVQKKKLLHIEETSVLECLDAVPINGFYYKDYPTFMNGMSCFNTSEDIMVSYCYRAKHPIETLYFFVEDGFGTKICYEYYNTICRTFFEIGSFALYKEGTRKEDGVKFFPMTKIGTPFGR